MKNAIILHGTGDKITDFWFASVNPLSVTNQAELIKQMKLVGTRRGGGC